MRKESRGIYSETARPDKANGFQILFVGGSKMPPGLPRAPVGAQRVGL